MSPSESVLMLKTRLGCRDHFPASPVSKISPPSYQESVGDDDLGRLAQTLDYLPLAMVQAAAFMLENSISVNSYLKLFEDDSLASQLLEHSFHDVGRDAEVPNSVLATWRLSIEQIQKQHPRSAELIFIMAYYEQLQIPAFLLQLHVGNSTVDFTTTIGVLLRFSLIGSGSGNSYNMHRLIQLTVKQWLATSGSSREWESKALRLISENFPNGEFETWSACKLLDSHAVKVVHSKSLADDDNPHLAVLQKNIAWYYFTTGRWTSAEEHGRASCQIFEKVYGKKNQETLAAMMKLTHILKQNGRLEEAETLAKQVVDETKSLLGSKHEQTFEAYENLALVYGVTGKLDLAEKACRKALSGREKALGPSHEDVFRSLRRLATILEYSGKYDAAETLITKAITGRRELAGPLDKVAMQATYRLAFIQQALGKYSEAEQTVRETLENQIAVTGITHIDTQKARYSLAVSLIAQSLVEEAETILWNLIEFIKTEHPIDSDHAYNFYIQFELGRIRTIQGRHTEAFEFHRIALDGIKKVHLDHYQTYEYQSAYAAALLRADLLPNLEESLKLQKEAKAKLKKALGENHPSTLLSLQRISELLAEKPDLSKALKKAKKVHRGREKTLKSGHPDTISAKAWVEELEARGKQNPDEEIGLEQTESISSSKKGKRRSLFTFRGRSKSDLTDVRSYDEYSERDALDKDENL